MCMMDKVDVSGAEVSIIDTSLSYIGFLQRSHVNDRLLLQFASYALVRILDDNDPIHCIKYGKNAKAITF